jgi:hypothetical protein
MLIDGCLTSHDSTFSAFSNFCYFRLLVIITRCILEYEASTSSSKNIYASAGKTDHPMQSLPTGVSMQSPDSKR